MITFYFAICGIILASLIISVAITYLYIKLIFLVSERYTPYSRNKSSYTSGDKGEYTSDTIKFVIFLKSIYCFTHLHDILRRFRYALGKINTNSEISTVYCNEEQEGYNKCNGGTPKPCFHAANLAPKKEDVNQNGTLPLHRLPHHP